MVLAQSFMSPRLKPMKMKRPMVPMAMVASAKSERRRLRKTLRSESVARSPFVSWRDPPVGEMHHAIGRREDSGVVGREDEGDAAVAVESLQ